MKQLYSLLFGLLLLGSTAQVNAQVPTCGANVPFFQVDLTGYPDGEWISPSHSRVGNCCGTSSPDRCTSFEIILDTGAAMINFEIASGAIPTGSMFYQIDCGPQTPVGDPICISGVGPHNLTFCKPGNNQNTYKVTSIAKPLFPKDDSTRIGCTLPVSIYGLENITITSVFPGTPGQYNSYLSCLDCSNPDFAPGLASPAYIDYKICGTPTASLCGYVFACDTVRLYAFSELAGAVTPNPAQFCNGGSGVLLTATSSGGDGSYSYEWFNSSSTSVGTGNTYNATSQENFTVAISDGLNSATCPSEYITVPVTIGQPPVVNAGTDQLVCANDPETYLSGSVSNATGGVWSGGSGTFNPDNTTLFASYTPTSAELASGSVTLTLTSTGAGGGCPNDFDQVTINFSDTVDVTFSVPTLSCYNSTGTLTANVSKGTAPYTLLWNTGEATSSINVGAGSYWVDVTDGIGCIHTENVTISAPSQMSLTMSSTDCSVDGASDGTASVSVVGGTPPYTYSWGTGGTGTTETGLSYGIATVTVTDANGCVVTGSVVVNEPQCLAFSVTASSTNATCYSLDDGTANAVAAGGTLPYSYSWNTTPPSASASVSGLVAGSYTVTVTDGNSCVDLATVTVSEPTQVVNNMTHVDIPVIGGNTGSATANPSGGTPGYTYLWSPGGETTQSIINQFAGTYYVDINDANSCAISDSVIINEPPCNNFNIGVTTSNVSCNGLSDGMAAVTIAHGTAPYSILWSDGQTGPVASNLAAGPYSVSVTDASNCTTFQNFTITEPTVLTIGLTPTNIDCYGAANGTIDLSVGGGTYPYTFVWMQGAKVISNAEDLVNLTPGTYSITVTDANGCVITGSVGITQPAKIDATSIKINATCNGYTDGEIDATVTGGTTPFTYSWTGPGGYTSSSLDITGLASGLYTLNVTDLNNCVLAPSHKVYIDQPDTVIIHNITVDCPVAGGTLANVTVDSVTGGAETDYDISYDNGSTYQGLGNYTASLGLNATYQVVAMDENGCQTVNPYVLTIDPGVVIDNVTFNPCIPTAATDIPVTVTPNGGDGGPYEVSTDNGATFNAPGVVIINLAVGNSYNIVVKDAKGCLSLPYSITIPNELIASAVIQNEVSCLGESDGSINLTVTGGTTAYSYSWTGPSGYTASTEDISGLVEGTYDVTVTDANGCTANTSILLTTFVDVTPPTISCPGDITVSNDFGVCGAVVTYSTPVGTDNCPLGVKTVMTTGLASGVTFPVGTTLVTYEVTDSAGNTASCSFNVTVNDTENPTITCPVDVAVNNDAGLCEAGSVVLGTPTTGDNCGVASTVNDAPAAFPVGLTVVTWTVTDIYGNVSTCTQNVTVTDNEDPTITCPVDVSVNNDPGLCEAGSVSLGTPTTGDNCGVATVTNDAPATFPVGTTVVTWTVTDVNGNSVTCTQNVTVTDNENPTITCPTDVTVSNDPGNCSTDALNISLGNPTTGDNCGVATTTNDAPAVFPVGTTTVTWTVTDINGNTATCTQDVTVVDNEDPTISCPVDISATSDPGLCEATTVSLGTPTTGDNCGIATVTNDAPATFPVGLTVVTWTVTDVNGNSVTCTQNVTVTDNEDPTITCPVDVSVNNDPGLCEAGSVSLGTPTTGDNCGVATVTNDAPATFPVGTTVVTWTVTDVNGNSVTCTQNVTVTDNENPTITCPTDVTVSNDPGNCSTDLINISLGNPITGDNCGVATVTNDAPATFPVGTTTVTWTVTDINGNSATCTQDVTVNDDEDPVFVSCPGDQFEFVDNVCDYTIIDYTLIATYSDNCGATISQEPVAGTVMSTGDTTIVLTIVDAAGNTAICSFNLNVADTLDPSFVGCPTDIIVNNDPGVCEAVVTWTEPTVDDNCGVTYTSSHTTGDTFTVGTTTVTYVATDLSGNTDTCQFTVTVVDNEAPLLGNCPPDTASCFSQVFYGQVSATDNCGVASVIQVSGLGSGAFFPVGTTTETYEVTDVNGNVSICSFTVTIHPTPVATTTGTDVTCYGLADGTIDLNVTSGTTPYDYLWNTADTTEDLSNLGPGTYDVTVTDSNFCQTTATYVVNEPDTLNVSENHVNVSCFGFNDGSIDVNSSGGVMPYDYSWSNGDTTQNIVDLVAGTYDLTLTDSNSCIYQVSVTITEPDSMYATATTIDATCLSMTGVLDLTVYGGTSPYDYNWSNADTTQDLTGVVAGTYQVDITDANGCTLVYVDSILSTNPLAINANYEDPLCFGDTNGMIEVFLVNAVEPITYDWSSGDTTSALMNLPAGTYSLTVTDSNQCTISSTYTLDQPDSLYLDLYSPEYTGGFNISSYLGSDGSIDLSVFGGTQPYDYLWQDGTTDEDLENIPAGTYSILVTDANGCTVQGSILLTHPLELEMPTGYSPNDDGYNDYFVVHGIEVFPNNTIEVYNRWGNLVYSKDNYQNEWNGENNNGDELPDGTYFVILKIDELDEPLVGYVDLRRTR